jgi:signal transduction histidine kinase
MTILNYAKLGMRHKDEATRDKSFEKILAAANRAAKITNSVLGMARNRSAGFEPTDLAKLIDESLVLLERELSKYRVSVERQNAVVPPALANGNQIQQVVLNLLINARQAMPNGGSLLVRLAWDEPCGMIDLVIRDSGCGIAADKLPKIFEPYYTTKTGPDESGMGGTGLGLATCREIIEAHHGRIRVESTPGMGTAFTLKLPIAKAAPVAATAPARLGAPLADAQNSPLATANPQRTW